MPREQQRTLEGWLFEDKLNYEEAWRRAQAELGFTGSVSSLKRYYVRRKQERLLESFAEAQEEAQGIVDAPASAGLFRTAAMKMVGLLFLQQVRDAPQGAKEWAGLAKLMLWQEDIELRRQLKNEENALRRENLAFAKERFHFNVVRRAEKVLPQLQELAEARKDPKLKEYEEARKMNAIMLDIFGSDVPKSDLHPENAEEEAAREEEERRKKAGEDAQAQRVRQESTARRQAAEAAALRQQELEEEDESMVAVTMEELARMAQGSVEKRVVERPPGRPTCITYQDWAKGQEALRGQKTNIERPTPNTEHPMEGERGNENGG
jgi:hypothetical protein